MLEQEPRNDPLRPEYWEGHTIGDECTQAFIAIRMSSGLPRHVSRRDKAARFAESTVKKAISKGEPVVVRRIQGAGEFDASSGDYPVGTILRINSEVLFYDEDMDQKYGLRTDFGVIYEDADGAKEPKKYIVKVDSRLKLARWIMKPNKSVGKTMHSWWVDAAGTIKLSGLTRYKSVEVLAFGKTSRDTAERESWKGFSFQPGLG